MKALPGLLSFVIIIAVFFASVIVPEAETFRPVVRGKRGVVTALDQFGTKSLAEVMQPAIELADGFPIDEMRVSYIERTRKIFEPWATSAKVFLPNGRVPKVGEMFAQPDLARTLREIVKAET